MTNPNGMPTTFETKNGPGDLRLTTFRGPTGYGNPMSGLGGHGVERTSFDATEISVRLVRVTFDLCVQREGGALSQLGKKLGLVNDVVVGDAEFDSAFKIDGKPADATRRYLNEEARQAILGLAALSTDGFIAVDLHTRGLLRIDVHGWPGNDAQLDRMTGAARLLAERAALID